jgi:hypothetical protein
MPARGRGRHGTGASCPSCKLAQEAATLSLVTRGGRVDPVGETVFHRSPLGPCPIPVSLPPDLSANEIRGHYTDETFTFANKCFELWLSTPLDPGADVPMLDRPPPRRRPRTRFANALDSPEIPPDHPAKKPLAKCSTFPALSDKIWSKIPTLNCDRLRTSAPCAGSAVGRFVRSNG